MGPRLVSRGNPPYKPTCSNILTASMGPRLVSRGNDLPEIAIKFGHPQLQWGRGLLAAEISRVNGSSGTSTIPASMGPRLVSRGNADRLAGPVHSRLASMGPRLVSRGNAHEPQHTSTGGYRFNGAAAC